MRIEPLGDSALLVRVVDDFDPANRWRTFQTRCRSDRRDALRRVRRILSRGAVQKYGRAEARPSEGRFSMRIELLGDSALLVRVVDDFDPDESVEDVSHKVSERSEGRASARPARSQ
jgi:hypothetical protein